MGNFGCFVFSLGILAATAKSITLDMSYVYQEGVTHYWNQNAAFKHQEEYPVKYYPYEGGQYWLESYTFSTSEHGGSHIDSPSHFAEGARTLENIPLSSLLNKPVIKVDLSKRAQKNPDTMLRVGDLRKWEKRYGRIPDDAVVMVYTAWHKRYGDWGAFMGVDENGKFHFPGFSPEATTWLCKKRNVVGLGIDTVSIDAGITESRGSHTMFSKNDKWALEIVANLEYLPPKGARLSVLPMKIAGGSGAPARIYATWKGRKGDVPPNLPGRGRRSVRSRKFMPRDKRALKLPRQFEPLL